MPLTPPQDQIVDEHLKDLKQHIVKLADEQSEEGRLEAKKLAAILADSDVGGPNTIPAQVLWQVISVPGIVWISAILAVTFGLLAKGADGNPAFADIAKVFAGAIVGASGASGAAVIAKH